jgi:hypothetical protein
MKTFIGLVLALASSLALAQSAEWKLSEIRDKGNTPVGYIYHSYAVGTEHGNGKVNNKSATGLRLICSTKGSAAPIIAIYWDTPLLSESTQSVMWMSDFVAIQAADNWKQEGKILYSSFSANPTLIAALKTRKTISASWADKYGVQRIAIYNLDGFNAHLNEFNSACKL